MCRGADSPGGLLAAMPWMQSRRAVSVRWLPLILPSRYGKGDVSQTDALGVRTFGGRKFSSLPCSVPSSRLQAPSAVLATSTCPAGPRGSALWRRFSCRRQARDGVRQEHPGAAWHRVSHGVVRAALVPQGPGVGSLGRWPTGHQDGTAWHSTAQPARQEKGQHPVIG